MSHPLAEIARLGRAAVVTDDVHGLAGEVLAALASVTGADLTGLLLLNDHGRLELVAGTGWHEGVVGSTALLRRPDTLIGYAATTGRAVLVADDRTEARQRLPAALVDHGASTALAVPVEGAAGTIGVMTVAARAPGSLDDDSLSMAMAFANVVATALERQRVTDALQKARLYDESTGLANEALLRDRTRVAIEGRPGRRVAVVAIGLTAPPGIAWDFPVAQRVLAAAARRLTEAMPGDTVARLPGLTLGLLYDRSATDADVDTLAARLVELFDEPLEVEGASHGVLAHVGVASPGTTDGSAEELIRQAQMAMERCVDRPGTRVEHFDPAMRLVLRERLDLIDDLRRAIESGDLDVAFQPAMGFRTGRVEYAEALLRWKREPPPPIPRMIQIAEETGLIVPLTDLVLRRACAALRWWRSRWGDRAPSVAVNLSPVQLRDPGLVESVASAMSSLDVPAGSLVLEITEGAMIDDRAAATAVLEQLRAVGVRLAVDDFGTGYSSLSYLRHLPIDCLKIDRSFIATLADERRDRAIVAAMASLARALGLVMVAEGVETLEQEDVLRTLGCDIGQGFLWSPALAAEDFVEWVERHAPVSPRGARGGVV